MIANQVRMSAFDFLLHAALDYHKETRQMPYCFGVPQETVNELHKDHRVPYCKFRSFVIMRFMIMEKTYKIHVLASYQEPHLVGQNHETRIL